MNIEPCPTQPAPPPSSSNSGGIEANLVANTEADSISTSRPSTAVKVKTTDEGENSSAPKKARPNEEDEVHNHHHKNNNNSKHKSDKDDDDSQRRTSSRLALPQHPGPVITNNIQNPRQLLAHLVPHIADVASKIPSTFDDFDICRLVYQIMTNGSSGGGGSDVALPDFDNLEHMEPDSSLAALNHASALSSLFLTPRDKLYSVNTLDECLALIESSRHIVVLTGAGCSVSCGIPDFRSRDGIYARLRVDFPDLPDPQSMFDICYFEHDPRPFFKFAKEIYPGQFRPSLSHMFIKKLELNGKLLRNYTQNIDTLEMTAQINNVIQCHGSFATATCTNCKYKVTCDYIKDRIFDQKIPYCDKCNNTETPKVETTQSKNGGDSGGDDENGESDSEKQQQHGPGILKPDIVFFGEGLPEIYHKSINDDKNKCDLLIVIGSSLKVKPVANIPLLLPKSVPQVLINRESLRHMNFDVELLGDCDVIVNEILMRLEQRRLARLQKEQEAAKKPDEAAEKKSSSEDTIEWADICKDKTLLNKIEGDEAENLIFSSENESEDEGRILDDDMKIPEKGDQQANEETKLQDQQEKQPQKQQDEKKKAEDAPKKEDSSGNNSSTPVPGTSTEAASAEAATATDTVKSANSPETDYLKESSYVYLRPNVYIFHGAEIAPLYMRKKLARLRRRYDNFVNGRPLTEGDVEEDDDDVVGGGGDAKREILKEDRVGDGYDSEEDEFSDEFETEDEDEDDEGEEDEDDDDDDGDEDNECSLKKLMEMKHNESSEPDEEESDEDFSLDKKGKEAKKKLNGESNGKQQQQSEENA